MLTLHLLSPPRRSLLVAPPHGGAALHPPHGLFATAGTTSASGRGGGPGVGGPAVHGSWGPADRLQPPTVPGALLLLRLVDRRLPLLHLPLRPLLPPVSHGSVAPAAFHCGGEGGRTGRGRGALPLWDTQTPPPPHRRPLDLCPDWSLLPLTVTDHISSWFSNLQCFHLRQ